MPVSKPTLCANLRPPLIEGMARLTHRAFAGESLVSLLASPQRTATSLPEAAALLLDASWANQLCFRQEQGLALQAQALQHCQIFRVRPAAEQGLRVLALMAPGDLMVNTPLDFITGHAGIALDLLYIVPGRDLPPVLPDHDVAFFAVSESDPASLGRLRSLFATWPRPALNDPARIACLSRENVAAGLSRIPGLCSPAAHTAVRAELGQGLPAYPALIRPKGSHAGQALAKLDNHAGLDAYLAGNAAERFTVTEFVDYRSPDGQYRKYRIACIEGIPYLCHMAVSEHWMVHYLSAGMLESPEKRAEEARAMARFDAGIAARHRHAFAELSAWMGLDYYQIDCAETPDGRLLVFEADVAAIVHAMDPPDLFPYKPPQMRQIFAAFKRMVVRQAALRAASAPAAAAAA